ncbi:MAG: hypothetical protein HYU03_01645 [Thaumarchaeota archaeon]|nr:hypothetical protein [Nitrososphaerota archaeon]
MREYIPMKELDLLVEGLETVVSKVKEGHGWSDVEEEAWTLYVKVEMMVTILKFRLAVERPGEIITMIEREPLTEHVIMALGSVTQARERAQGGDHRQALEGLRVCRNNLRVFLEATRRLRLKAARAKAMGSGTSSQPS